MSYVAMSGTETTSFADGIAAGRSALTRLAVMAAALRATATSLPQQSIGEQAYRFATDSGKKGLDRAEANNDVAKLKDMQRSIREVSGLAASELRDSIVERFMTLNILPPSLSDLQKEAVNQIKVPNLDEDVPVWVKAAIGLGAMVSVAYVIRSFK